MSTAKDSIKAIIEQKVSQHNLVDDLQLLTDSKHEVELIEFGCSREPTEEEESTKVDGILKARTFDVVDPQFLRQVN